MIERRAAVPELGAVAGHCAAVARTEVDTAELREVMVQVAALRERLGATTQPEVPLEKTACR